MTTKEIVAGMARWIFRLLLAVVLLVLGLLVGLYSPALQDSLKDAAVHYVNSRPGTMTIGVDRLRLRFPLKVQVSGLTACDRETGDTLIAAESFYGKIDVLPLLKGDIDVSAARLINAVYVQGAPDSTLYLQAHIGKLDLEPVSVSLGDPMTINLENVTLAESRVSIAIRPDTLAADTTSTPTPIVFKAGKVHFVDFTYDMSIAGNIDSLAVNFGDAVLADATIDLGGQTVDVTSLKGEGLAAAFVTAAVASESSQPESAADDAKASEPWTVNVGDIDFNGGSALYTSAGYQPEPGLDFGYICVDSLRLHITDFYNRAASVRLPISALHATERCGVTLDALGEVAIDSAGLSVKHFILTTPAGTALKAEALMGMGDTATDATLPLEADVSGNVSTADFANMFPAAALIAAGLPAGAPVEIAVLAKGTSGTLPIERLAVKINHCIEMQADGTVYWPMNSDKLAADLDLSGRVYNVTPLKNKLFDKALAQMLNIPPMTIDGHMGMRGNYTDCRVRVLTGKGELAGKGSWLSTTEGYKADVRLRDFPVDAFLPTYGVGRVSATAKVEGRGLNPQSTRMVADADIALQSAEYGDYVYHDIALIAKVADGNANVRLASEDVAASFVLTAEGNLAPEPFEWSGTLDATNIDLRALKMSDSEMTFATRMDFTACMAAADTTMELHVKVPALSMRDSTGILSTDDMAIDFLTDARYTHARLINEDLTLSFDSYMPLDTILARVTNAQDSLTRHIAARRLSIETLQSVLPDFALNFTAGNRNIASRYLQRSDMKFDKVSFRATNDSLISMLAGVDGLSIGKTTNIDTLCFTARQDSSRMLLNMYMENLPGTFDEFAHVKVNGFLDSDQLKLMLNQKNIDDKTGFDLGVLVTYADSTLTANFIPVDPTIGYKPWTLNADNYIAYNLPHKHLDANLHLQNAASILELYTEHIGGHHDHDDGDHEHEDDQEDVVLRIKDLQLSDWLAVNPFAPPIKGVVSADMRVNWSADALNGSGSVEVDSLYYGKERVGNFLADIDLSTNTAGTVRAKAGLTVNGVRTVDIEGNLNDSTAENPFNLDFSMIHFPLETVNPFLVGNAKLRGTLNGKMDITGDLNNPKFNGTLDFDSTAITVTMLGATYNFSEAYIDVVDSKVSLRDFAILGVNKNPLFVNGTVDITNMDNAGIDLTFKARDMGLVNSKKAPKGADVYGKAFIDLDATAKGNMRFVDVDASMTLLAGTDVYYNVPDATNAIQSMQNDKMVRFVRFADSTSMADLEEVPPTMTMALDAVLNIESGTTITVNISADGSDRLQIAPEGTLNYTQPPLSDGRLTGRLNINSGQVRYSLPVLGEKKFDFESGSYLNFTGQLMNPALNLQAVDKVRANVTQEGQNSRLINFDVGLSVTGTLNTMNVAFDLSTGDDLTIANELQSMTAEQRASQAMNLLLYGTYTGSGVKADANMSGNALYGFLESQLNSWAANAIKGVDLSFGIDQYDRTLDGNTSTATQYSYRVSKSLFNNRFKIIVGGNYSTDANTDENFAQNLINDISFEYLINRQGTMYVRLFRHTGYESILEGEVTQTGVGFVYRRKIRKLIDMFRPFRKYTSLTAAPINPVTIPNNTAADEKKTSN